MSAPLLGREEILAVLHDLAEELDRNGIRAEVFLVGGAAMTLAYDTRRATRDVDAIFEPKQTVYEAARRVADGHGLPGDWLNDAVKGFLHGDDPDAVPVLDIPGLRVDVAYLLAMKLLAARDEDVDGVTSLPKISSIRSEMSCRPLRPAPRAPSTRRPAVLSPRSSSSARPAGTIAASRRPWSVR